MDGAMISFSPPAFNCRRGGIMLKCVASDPKNPWNNFVSDFTNWSEKNGDYPMCDEGAEIFFTNNLPDKFTAFYNAGSKVIWANAGNETVTLVGSPKISEN